MEDEGPTAHATWKVIPIIVLSVQGKTEGTIAAYSSINAEKRAATHYC